MKSIYNCTLIAVKLAKARRGMIKDKGDKVGGNRNTIKEEIPDADAGVVIKTIYPIVVVESML